MVWKVCLHTWMTPGLALRTGKHTSDTWRLFSMLWLPMVWQLTLKNVFLQPPLLKFLATRIQRRGRPLRPITPPKSKTPTPSGHQTVATFPRHGKLLPPFLAKLCPGSQTFDRSPEGRGQNCNGPPPLRRLFHSLMDVHVDVAVAEKGTSERPEPDELAVGDGPSPKRNRDLT
jgi:hypothetical protein